MQKSQHQKWYGVAGNETEIALAIDLYEYAYLKFFSGVLVLCAAHCVFLANSKSYGIPFRML